MKWRTWLLSSGIALVSAACLVVAAKGAIGLPSNASTLSDASIADQVESAEQFVLPDDSHNIGMTETELKVLAAGEGMERQPEWTQEPQSVIGEEEAWYRRLAETGTFDISQDEDGRKYWSVEAYGGLTAVLGYYVDRFSKIHFRGDDSVAIKFLPEAVRSDGILAAQLAFNRIAVLNEVYVELYEVGQVAAVTRERMQTVSDRALSEEEAEAFFKEHFKLVEL